MFVVVLTICTHHFAGRARDDSKLRPIRCAPLELVDANVSLLSAYVYLCSFDLMYVIDSFGASLVHVNM